MGLFSFLKNGISDETPDKKEPKVGQTTQNKEVLPSYADSSTIDADERKYYQTDDYYVYITNPGTAFAKKIITFDERKKISYPSSGGLYVAEILLLEYCTYGSYPKPKNGYPGFWWFEYGIRDVGHVLESLCERGYIILAVSEKGLKALTVAELKAFADSFNIPVSGKKSDIIKTISSNIDFEKLQDNSELMKYELTELGTKELEENAYVPYMHKHSRKTIEGSGFGESFTVWDINKLLHGKDINKWREIVGAVEKKRFGINIACQAQEETGKQGNSGKSTDKQLQYTTEEMRQFLVDKKPEIKRKSKTSGDGLNEELKGIELKKLGKDKEALVLFYVAICKGLDVPAVYRETMILLRKYKLFEEEQSVCKTAMRLYSKKGWDKSDLEKRVQKIEALIKKRDQVS